MSIDYREGYFLLDIPNSLKGEVGHLAEMLDDDAHDAPILLVRDYIERATMLPWAYQSIDSMYRDTAPRVESEWFTDERERSYTLSVSAENFWYHNHISTVVLASIFSGVPYMIAVSESEGVIAFQDGEASHHDLLVDGYLLLPKPYLKQYWESIRNVKDGLTNLFNWFTADFFEKLEPTALVKESLSLYL